MAPLLPTGSQTLGPFFHDSLLRGGMQRNVLTGPDVTGQRLRIEGHVLDGDGAPLPDALIEIWQANSYGRYHHPADSRQLPLDPHFSGFGRSGTDREGAYWFETIKPGPVPFDEERMQAPHIGVAISGRGLLNHLYTRLYFADEPATAGDPLLALVPAGRRGTLLAHPVRIDGIPVYRFDIRLQGADETVFFDYRELEFRP